jgi:aldose 1-epimerase
MIDTFGTLPDGREVQRVRIAGGGLTASVLTYGAVLQDLRLAGHAPALVLGFEDLPSYLEHSPYFGATAGRCANRIRGGTFELDGTTFETDRNALGRHTLHGGSQGVGKRLWTLGEVTVHSVELTIEEPDGHMGFPGTLAIRAVVSLLEPGVLDIRYTATTDAATLCNLAHHSYFVLDDSGHVKDHRLAIDAESYLPTDADFVATGEVRRVDGTSYDFRDGRTIREANEGGPIDCNFCVGQDREPIREVGQVSSAASGVEMTIRTTEPGLQVYDAARLDVPVPGLDGRRMGPYCGLALEPQVWPDAIHHEDWPSPVLHPGETYDQHTQFVFRKGRT